LSPRSRVLVVGESLVDVVVAPGRPPVEAPGGSPLNVAVTLARLGVSVDLLTALGPDARGGAIRAHLVESGVSVLPTPPLERTSSAVARIGADASATYEFDLTWPAFPVPDLGAEVLHVGSVAFFHTPTADMRTLLRFASGAGALTTLDPNVRPALIGDRAAAVLHLEQVLPWVDVVKLSDEDAAWLYPGLTNDEVADRLLREGPRLVALTLGAEGAVLHSAWHQLVVAPIAVEVVDTIGAGDAWMGALISGLLDLDAAAAVRDGLGLDDLAAIGDFAAAVAAITAGRHGADPPRLDDLPAPATKGLAHG
jgi:fructokinase